MEFHQKPHTYVHQIHLWVQDLQRSLVFYEKVLGFRILTTEKKKATLTVDGVHPLIILEADDNILSKQARRTGLYHFALLLPTRKDLANMLVHLMQTGFTPEGASDHDVSEALYLTDPDGHGIEIYIDKPSHLWTWQEGQVYMGANRLNIDDLLTQKTEEGFVQLPKETVLGHIHLHVADLERAEEFYTKGLGFKTVLYYGGQAIFLSTGNYHHHVGLNVWNGIGIPAPDTNHVHLQSYAIIYENEQVRQGVVERLQSLGYTVAEELGAFITQDPAGTTIRLVV